MGPKTTAKGRARRTHSLGGCATCRRRHVKCDQVQPLCLTCRAIGVTCEGYSSNVQWMTPSTSSKKSGAKRADAGTTRRHLYTEKSRASMSTELTANLSSNSVDASLNEIDNWSRNNPSSNSKNLAVGPFGVLDFSASTSTPVQPSTSGSANENAPSAEESGVEPSEEVFTTPSTIDPLMSLDDSLQWADLFALDFGDDYLMQQDPFGPIVQDLVADNVKTGTMNDSQTQNQTSNARSMMAMQTTSLATDMSVPLIPISPLANMTTSSSDLLDDIHFLLRHFQDTVIDIMAGVPWTIKSPWKTMNLASAVQTLADMTFLSKKDVKHASAANLHSIVSLAACHLASSSPDSSVQPAEHWSQISERALEKARYHLEQSMRNEFQGSNKAKYKEQLMATIATMCASADVRQYMLEAERVLRLRGLAKRDISRKARTLHHIYTWARIVGESTYVLHDYNSYAPAVQKLGSQHPKQVIRSDEPELAVGSTAPSTKHNSRLDDFLRVETQHDSDLEIDEPKEAAVGLHDIHLEDSRNYSASFFLQIYGIPETWLSLVSQTTRLANVMSTLKVSDKETNVAFQNALRKRASRLENMICSFAFKTASADTTTIDTGDGTTSPPMFLPNHHMVRALNSALVIFFYRRIKDVNPWILQSHVDAVIKALQDFNTALLEEDMIGPGTAWPAFIAGCEALAPHRREALLQWIQAGKMKSGLRSYSAAEEVLLEVWKRRDDPNNGPSPRMAKSADHAGGSSKVSQAGWTWLDVSRDRNIWLMLF